MFNIGDEVIYHDVTRKGYGGMFEGGTGTVVRVHQHIKWKYGVDFGGHHRSLLCSEEELVLKNSPPIESFL